MRGRSLASPPHGASAPDENLGTIGDVLILSTFPCNQADALQL